MKGSDLSQVLSQVSDGVIIDFTQPEVTVETVKQAVQHKVPVVIGTTSLDKEQQDYLTRVAQEIPILWAPNMSVGMNALLEFLPKFSQILGQAYDLELSEIHHKHKKDAPSGTAVKMAQNLASSRGWDEDKVLKYSREGIIGERPHEEIGVQALRGGDVVGEHTIYFFGPGERIDVTHRVYSRDTFAQGALRAAQWIINKKPGPLYSMSDLFAEE
jgi:4-hydroxy-tetrahydrodipicolinate reductase